MSKVLERAPVFSAASLRSEAPSEAGTATVRDARTLGAPARADARDPILRPIDLERRARFARIEADAPRGA